MITLDKKGFIALFSVIVISFVLLITAVTLSFTGFFVRFNIYDSENKERSNALADACIESARLVLATNSGFTGSDDAEVDGEICNYTISSGGEIQAWALVNSAHTYYYAEVDLADPEMPLIDFQECADLSPCP